LQTAFSFAAQAEALPTTGRAIQLVAMAGVCIALGMLRFSHGVLVVLNWQAMPVYSGAVVGTGVALLLFAAIPFSWMEAVAHRLDSGRRRG
jgi:hypothetical protein